MSKPVGSLAALATMVALVWTTPAHSLSIAAQGFDQVEVINDLGGTVTQVGGGNPGGAMLTSDDFVGLVGTSTGVTVALSNYVFAFDSRDFDSAGSVEPGNFPALLLGSPTDITFTVPGTNGPDGSSGDGSVEILAGGTITLGFRDRLELVVGETADIFLFSDTAGGGTALIELLDRSQVVDSITLQIESMFPEMGTGGALLDTDIQAFDELRITVISGGIELDAVAVAAVPEPAAAALLVAGLLSLLVLARRGQAP